MKIIAIANSKGGCGKTATVLNLGAALAQAGRSTLLIDMDPQASLTEAFKLDFPQATIYTEDVLASPKVDASKAPIKVRENLYLMPATEALGGLESVLNRTPDEKFRLRDVIRRLGQAFDFIIIDPPGSTDIFMATVLAAAEEVMIPVRPTDTDFCTLAKFKETIDAAQTFNPKLKVRSILFNQVITSANSKKIYRGFLEGHEWESLVANPSIRMATSVATAPAAGKNIFEFDPKSKVAADYKQLASEVLAWN